MESKIESKIESKMEFENGKYKIFKNLLQLTPTTCDKLKSYARKHSESIFNPDYKRLQTPIDKTHFFYKIFEDALIQTGITRGRQINDMVLLYSKKGCKKQSYHYDYNPYKLNNIRRKPCGVLFAIEPNTKINILKKGEVYLDQGDCLVFEGDCVHAGSSYNSDNVRLHTYLDVIDIKRSKNSTWFY